ncbi:DUF218 domain-containing protein [Sphingopyxis sp. YR583]|uniref:YdcF family protein n=1 Tax=Sphingopyxis sp. YR583 TaxID=1881047 RepID=UPI0008A780B0|nr:YdcF family protein [Sphingopyxis sp. YR583]SEH12942.1 DUF218 domain-containing protein [Sphingopyxis sp. YR583]
MRFSSGNRAAVALAFTAVTAAAVISCPAKAQSRHYQAVRSGEPLRDRIAYLLTLLAADSKASEALARDPALALVGERLAATERELIAVCADDKAELCPVEKLMLTGSEIDAVAAALARLAGSEPALQRLVQKHLRSSGRYQLHAGLDDAALLAAAWKDAALAVNRIYRLYALGEKPAYPAIDSLDRDPKAAAFQGRLAELVAMGGARTRGTGDIFAPWSRSAMDLLTLVQREEAARYEPLDSGANRPANTHARGVDWKRFRYTAILVPGNGLAAGERAVSPIGELRLKLAVERWRQGLAPFIIVSGGHAHPNRTEFSEAVEMKRLLVMRYGVPERAVLIDPYARHTTTNLRNAVRLLFRAGAPMDRTFLVTSSPWQASYVAEAGKTGLIERSKRELGYVPYRDASMVSAVDVAVMPDVLALQSDPEEPLDP